MRETLDRKRFLLAGPGSGEQSAGFWEGFCLGTGCAGEHPYQQADMGLSENTTG